MTTSLVKYDAARHAIAEARRIDEAKNIRDKAIALQAYARQAKDEELQRWVTEIRLRAERRTGELLREAAKADERDRRGGDRKSMSSRNDIDRPTLSDLGISRNESSLWQKLAAIPAPEFEKRLASALDPALLTTRKIVQPPAQQNGITPRTPSGTELLNDFYRRVWYAFPDYPEDEQLAMVERLRQIAAALEGAMSGAKT